MAHPIAHNGFTKVCCKCKTEKPLTRFSRRADRGGGYQSACKQCAKGAFATFYDDNREAQVRRTREYERTHPEAIDKKNAANRARHHRIKETPEYLVAHRKHELTRRGRKHQVFLEEVDPQVVYEMHGGRCGICAGFIDLKMDEYHVDHVIPLSKGGMHGYINVQPSHARCNLRKGAKL